MQVYHEKSLNLEYHDNPNYYVAYHNNYTKGIVFFLHGGPVYRYFNRYDNCIDKMLKNGFIVVLVNYSGSAGYGKDYVKQLFHKGGTIDLQDVVSVYNMVSARWPKSNKYFIGDSYGAYLVLRLCFIENVSANHFYATNTFTDLRYQLLFSTESQLIKRYFQTEDIRLIEEYNPIDIANKKAKNLSQILTIINGKNDRAGPFFQIEEYKRATQCKVVSIEDYPHFKVISKENSFISEYILKDILRHEGS